MSPKNILLTVGLTALGFFGYAATRSAYSGDPVPPSGPSAAPASPATPSVLLLTNGRLIQGPITRDEDNYVISQNGGEIRFHKSQVEDVFGSLVDVYKYKLDQIPVNDPDEHMKLAKWCLAQNLPNEARTELKTVLAVSPGSNDAKMMLVSLNASEARANARPRVDPGLVQTGGEMPQSIDNRPAEIDVNVLREANKRLGPVGLPVIFDLPPAIAVKRAQHFTQFVHPVLQVSCAKCHNEKYEGDFQLVEVKNKRKDMTWDVIRANLDATLKLIDPANPSKSELLSISLIPHGSGANRKPIFRGSNDPRFQIFAAWANSLRTTKPSQEGIVQTKMGRTFEPNGPGSSFATDRNGPLDPSQTGDGMPKSYVPFEEAVKQSPVRKLPSTRYLPGQGMVTDNSPPSSDEFPAPYMAGGPRPKLKPGTDAGLPLPLEKTGRPKGDPEPIPMPRESLPDLPPVPGSTPLPSTPTDPTKPAKPKKSVKIPDSVLEKMLQNRNNGR